MPNKSLFCGILFFMKNIAKIIQISKPLHKLVYLLASLILFNALLELVSTILSKYAVDIIGEKIKGQSNDITALYRLIIAIFSVSFLSVIINTVTDRLGDHFAGRIRQFLTEKFYYKVLSLPQTYFDTEISGKIVNQLNRGIVTIQSFFNTASNFMLPTIVQTVFTIALMAYYNLPIALFTALVFPIYLSLSYYSTKKWGIKEVEKNKIEDYTRGRIREVIGNMRLVKGFNTQSREYASISQKLTDINTIYAQQSRTFHIFDFLRNTSLITIMAIVTYIVFYQTYNGILSLGEMVLISQLLNQARRPLFAMSFILTQIQTAESGSKEFLEILAIPSTENFENPLPTNFLKNPTIEFRHVHFAYPQSDKVLRDISFILKKKEKIALVGHSGVGKSTVVNLILKLYEPTKGVLLLNGQKYEQLEHSFVRHNMALVFQESELFSTTIRENVAYGKYGATETEVIRALKLANAYDFVMKLPKQLDSAIGERGVRLSGGQRQRIQIARAILTNAPILILDEATSNLDSKSEFKVQMGLENLMKERLVIMIAHRLSTIQSVDRIIVLDENGIADQGSPKVLAQRPGIYSNLLKYQLEGNKKLLEEYDIF